MALKWETNVKNGVIKFFFHRFRIFIDYIIISKKVCSLEFDRKDIIMNKLLATTLESKLHVFDMRTQNDNHGGFASVSEKAHGSTVWLGKHLPQNRELFMTCGGGGSMYLWK